MVTAAAAHKIPKITIDKLFYFAHFDCWSPYFSLLSIVVCLSSNKFFKENAESNKKQHKHAIDCRSKQLAF